MGEIGVFLRASSYLHDKEPVVLRCSVTARALDSEPLSLALTNQPLSLALTNQPLSLVQHYESNRTHLLTLELVLSSHLKITPLRQHPSHLKITPLRLGISTIITPQNHPFKTRN